MRKKLFTILFALVTSMGLSWADNPAKLYTEEKPSWVREGDDWDDATKTLTVNSDLEHDVYANVGVIQQVVISSGVTSIGDLAFYNCENIEAVTIPNSVTSIGMGALGGCSSLTSVVIPNSVTSLAGIIFVDCTSLSSVTIPNSVTSIGQTAFQSCTSLTSITIPSSVTDIEDDAFNDCPSMDDVYCYPLAADLMWGETSGDFKANKATRCHVFADQLSAYETKFATVNVTFVGDLPAPTPSWVRAGDDWDDATKTLTVNSDLEEGAYKNNTEIQHVIISDGVTSIGKTAFNYCSNLSSVTIPNSVTSIGMVAFGSCEKLSSVTIPNGVTRIEGSTFASCYILSSVTIPNSVTIIKELAFASCYGLTSIEIPNSVDSIGMSAFSICTSLSSVTIPSSVTFIDMMAFMYCDHLTTVTCEAVTPPTLGDKAFDKSPLLAHIYVPAESVSAYKSAWSAYEAMIEAIPDPTPVIKLNADFSGWEDTDAFTDNGNGTASWSISTLTAGYWYHFGVKVDGTWTSDNADFDRENPSRAISGTGDAMWFQADAEGEYTFTWEYATNTLTIGFPNPVKPNSIIINGTAPKVGDTSVSLDYYFNPANVPGFYAYYAPTLKLKCVEDDNYSETTLDNNSISLGVRNLTPQGGSFQAGKTYQICFAYYANSAWHDDVFQTLTFSSNTVGMKGSWDNWTDVVNFTDNGDGTASATKTFEHEGYYTFKTVLDGDTWRGNGEAFKRNYTGAEGIVGNTDMTLWVDAKGEYTFTWTYASNRIDITYPALPTVYLYLNGSADAFTNYGDGTVSYYIHFNSTGSNKEFKIRLGESDWRSNGQAFNPVNTTYDWINDAGGGAYMKIYIDAEADYTFTWTYAENKLEITHPVVPDYTVMTKVDPEDPSVYYSTFYSSNYSYKLMDDGTVAFIAKISSGDLVLTQIAEGEQVIPKGTAVIFRKTGSSIPVGLRDTEENNTSFDPADNDLEGVNVATPVTDIPGLTVDNCYVLSGKSHDETVSGVGFYKIYGNTLKQHKAYVKYAGGQNNAPKKMRFVYGQATGIEDVQGNNVQSTKVIENGVLYIIRDGKTYNAMGQMVK